LKLGEIKRSLSIFREGGKEMGTPKTKNKAVKNAASSKGTIFSCIHDADTNKKLRDEIVAFIQSRGEGYTGKTFMERFHAWGYLNVSLEDATNLLDNIRQLKDPNNFDYHY
jgi:hypothetical protein